MPNKDGKKMFEYTNFKRKKSVGYEEIEYNSVDKRKSVYFFREYLWFSIKKH